MVTSVLAPIRTGELISVKLDEDPSSGIAASYLGQISMFLADFNQLYELIRVSVDLIFGRYQDTRQQANESLSWLLKGGRSVLSREDTLTVLELSKQSPLTLIAVVAATPATATTMWVLVQIADKILRWRLDRQIQELQCKKLQLEVDRLATSEDSKKLLLLPPLSEIDVSYLVRNMGKGELDLFSTVTNQLEKSPIKISHIDFDIRKSYE